MSADKELAKASWLNETDTRAVMAALEADGGKARFVGGSVRNALLGEPVLDIDIATNETPERASALLSAKGIKVVPTGIAHGTVTAVTPTRHFEITTLRVDVKSHGRHADVAFTEDWQADAERRDFTMNALYCDADGTVHDPLGEGRADLKARRVRFIGDAKARIREDYLRILRFFRIHAWYGAGEPDAVGLRACADLREGLRQLSGERVRDELLKIAAADDAGLAFRQMAAAGILSIVLAGSLASRPLREARRHRGEPALHQRSGFASRRHARSRRAGRRGARRAAAAFEQGSRPDFEGAQ